MAVIKLLAEVRRGMTRKEISEHTNINNGGSLTVTLSELEQCGFIREFAAFNKSDYGKMYQLADPYTLFYLTFLSSDKVTDWMHFIGTPAYYAWAGLAFETVCTNHIEQIKEVMGISGISADVYSWQSKGSETRKGAQIDMLIDRADRTVNICEIKFTEAPFAINGEYKNNLINKRELFREITKTKKAVNIVLISANGVSGTGVYEVAQRVITGEDLFL